MNIKLGQKVRDKVTGFEGIATARVEYLSGCVQFCVKPKMTEPGKMPEGQYIDDIYLEVIEDSQPVETEPSGGLMSDTPPDR